jgi:hypothetical protein
MTRLSTHGKVTYGFGAEYGQMEPSFIRNARTSREIPRSPEGQPPGKFLVEGHFSVDALLSENRFARIDS